VENQLPVIKAANIHIFTDTVLLVAQYDDVLRKHLNGIIDKNLNNKVQLGERNRANRNTFISKTTVNAISGIIARLIKKLISEAVKEAGLFSV
jgi:hypothetical protein